MADEGDSTDNNEERRHRDPGVHNDAVVLGTRVFGIVLDFLKETVYNIRE